MSIKDKSISYPLTLSTNTYQYIDLTRKYNKKIIGQ